MSHFAQKDIKYVQTSNGEFGDKEETKDILFVWGVQNYGFGTTSFYYKDGKLKCDNETMSKSKIKKLMCQFVDNAEFQS